MTTRRLGVRLLWAACTAVLGLALPGVSARAHDEYSPCKQIMDREQWRACEYTHWRLHRCREDWRSCGFGALGDSQVDEYRGFSNMAGFNWLEQLARIRGLDFGAYQVDPTVRGEPRNSGYARDWGRDAASVTPPTWADLFLAWDLAGFCLANFGSATCPGNGGHLQALGPFSAQVEGLAAQVSAGEVQIVVMMMGTNDFKIYQQYLGGTFSGPDWDRKSADVVAGLLDAVDRLQAAGPVMMLVANIPSGGYGDVGNTAVDGVNAELAAALASRGVPMFDEYSFFYDSSLQRVTPSPDGTFDVDLMVGSYAIPVVPWSVASVYDLVSPDDPRAIGPCRLVGWQWQDPFSFSETPMCATLEYELNADLDDGMHISTLPGGLAANVVLDALQKHFGLEIPLLRPNEILCSAGIADPGRGHHHPGCAHDGR